MTRIVELDDSKPLVIDPTQHEEKIWICRCGLSKDWPYCDSSHKQARKEEPGKTYAYTRDADGTLQPRILDDAPDARVRS